MNKGALFSELKRRNVLRAGAIYIAAVWALAQGISQLAPSVGLPNWVTRWFLVAVMIGFPFWIAFAWFYEFTPSGLKRESELAPCDSIGRSTGRKLDFWIIGILAVAVVLLVTNTFVLHRDATSTGTADAKTIAAELAKVPEQSVAVLPLINESGNPKQRYFVDGLSAELISDLTEINGLKVIGQYSSFKFRNSKASPAQIGAMLGVANLIQGLVFQQGNRIRITVSLIHAKDGSSVWSHSYDEQLSDVFAIQTQIGRAVADALKVKLLGKIIVASNKPPSGNVEAYQFMLQGRSFARRATEAGLRQGIALYQQALKLDPNYAYVWGQLSNASINLGGEYLSGDARQRAYAQARAAVDEEQLLAPDVAYTHSNRGYLLSMVDHDPVKALAEYKLAHALAPNDTTSLSFLAYGLEGVGQLQAAVELYRKAIATNPLLTKLYSGLANALLMQGQFDATEEAIRKAQALSPDNVGLYSNLAVIDMARGQLDAAEKTIRKVLVLQPDLPALYANLASIDILRGNAAAALRDAEQETDPVYGPWIRAMANQIGPDHKQADAALHDYITRSGKTQPYLVADLYALRKQPEDMFEWLRRAKAQPYWYFQGLLSDPFVLAYQHDPRFAALCKQAGLPLPGGVLPGDAVPASGATR